MAARPAVSERWQRYYAAAGTEPRATLLEALARFEAEGRPPGRAVDLGCGNGRDTLELLRRGWRVVAVDAEPRALELLRATVADAGTATRLQPVAARLADVELPPAELVNASFSLPFAPPAEFARTWTRIRGSLRTGGRFAGHLFGPRDQWAPAPDMSFHDRDEIELLLAGLDVEVLEERDEDGQTTVGDAKHWHLFSLVARHPS